MKVLCLLFTNESSLNEIAEACFRFTPQIAVSDEAIFLEIGKCLNLYTVESLKLRVQALLKRFGKRASMGIAEDIPTSLAMARFKINAKEKLPITALDSYFSPFKRTDAIDGLMALMAKLGIHNLEAFLKLPTKTIPSRFGKDALTAIQRVHGAEGLPWPQFVVPQFINEKTDIDSALPLKNLEPLLFQAKFLLDRAMARLKGRYERALSVEFLITQEPYSNVKMPLRSFKISLSRPQGSTLGLLPILKERLEKGIQERPLESAVLSLEFKILETCPGNESQKDFFNKKEEEQEQWDSLVERLREKLGRDKTFVAAPVQSYIPEKSWAKATQDLDHDRDAATARNLPFPERPLRLLQNPEPVKSDGPRLSAQSKSWNVVDVEGPEHISGEWWFDEIERDYYCMNTESGETLWVFWSPKIQKYFLHGYFD